MGLYSDLHRLQEGRCGICAEQMTGPVEDHDHTTGFVRGLLCRSCNTREGQHSSTDECRLGTCPVCIWRATPAVVWLGYTERFEGWVSNHREDIFRFGSYRPAVALVEERRMELGALSALLAAMGDDAERKVAS